MIKEKYVILVGAAQIGELFHPILKYSENTDPQVDHENDIVFQCVSHQSTTKEAAMQMGAIFMDALAVASIGEKREIDRGPNPKLN